MLMWLGYSMVATFMVLIMTRRLSALVALIIVPILFGLLAGHGADLGAMTLKGLAKIAPTAVLLLFAVLYFSIMIDAGLFEPLVRRILAFGGDNPVRVVVGTALMAVAVSLDGDATTTVLVVVSAFLPVYRRLGLNPMVLGVVLACANTVINIAPWGGPTGRAAVAVQADVSQVFVPLIPTMAVGILATLAMAWYFGLSERRRLASASGADQPRFAGVPIEPAASVLVPGSAWRYAANLGMTLLVLGAALTHILPLQFVFMAGLAVALMINFPNPEEQRKRLTAHAENALPIVVLILAAGVFTGVLTGTGMVAAMAEGLAKLVPDSAGGFFGPITGVLAIPLTFLLSNDAYYFGVVPVLARTAAAHGVEPLAIARASLLAQPTHALSPLAAALYLLAGMLDVDVGSFQRFALKWLLLLTFVLIISATVTGAII